MQSPSVASAGTPDRTPARDSPARGEAGKRPAPTADGAPAAAAGAPSTGPASKRPRYEGKAFNELTVSELENVVREALELKRQLVARDEEIVKLKGVADGKSALAKQVKSLEAELAGKQKEAEKLQSTVREQDKDVSVQAERVKRSLQHQLVSQMFWHSSLKEQLQGSGREVVAFAPNVSLEVLKALGAEHGTKTKHADAFFESLPTKTAQNGQKLVLLRSITVKYVKASCELRVDATYRSADAAKLQKKQAKKEQKKKQKTLKNKAKGGKDEEGEGEEEGQDEEGEDEDEGEGEEEDEAEAEKEAEADGEPDALAQSAEA